MNFISSHNKAFYSVTSASTVSDNYAPANFEDLPLFDQPFSYIPVTQIQRGYENGLTPEGIRVTRSIASSCMGNLYLNNKLLSTAITIDKNHVLVPRHCIEDANIETMTFFDAYNHPHQCRCVVEEDAALDYAILDVPELYGEGAPFTQNYPGPDCLLLHSPRGCVLGVSGHSIVEENYVRTDGLMSVYHDTDYQSCGGAYVASCGKICAIHLGIDVTQDGYSFSANMGTGNPERLALPIQTIVSKNPNGYLARLLRNDADHLEEVNVTYLKPFANVFDWEREGRESQKKLTQLLSSRRQVTPTTRPQIFTQQGIVNFKTRANVNNLNQQYPNEFQEAYEHSLGWSGLHGSTHDYSINGHIESDHPLPWDVWNRTTNLNMQNIVQNGTTRKRRRGEDQMPAMTIPYATHKNLMTTGNGADRKNFRQQLVNYCDQGKPHLALHEVIKDYRKNDLLGPRADPQYKEGWKDMLDHFHADQIITQNQKEYLRRKL